MWYKMKFRIGDSPFVGWIKRYSTLFYSILFLFVGIFFFSNVGVTHTILLPTSKSNWRLREPIMTNGHIWRVLIFHSLFYGISELSLLYQRAKKNTRLNLPRSHLKVIDPSITVLRPQALRLILYSKLGICFSFGLCWISFLPLSPSDMHVSSDGVSHIKHDEICFKMSALWVTLTLDDVMAKCQKSPT